MTLSVAIRNIVLIYHLLFLGTFLFIEQFKLLNLFCLIIFWVLFGCLGIEITFHRALSHQSLILKKFWENLFIFFGCLGLNSSPLFWMAVHRRHHKYADQDLDLHTPKEGRWHSYFGWTFIESDTAFLGDISPEFLKNRYQRFLHKYYLPINYLFTAICISISYKFYFLSILPAQIITFHQVSLVNLFCHTKNLGYRNFDLPDNSSNNLILSLLTWGLGLHNNHHKNPKAEKLSIKPNEIDLGYILSRPFISKN